MSSLMIIRRSAQVAAGVIGLAAGTSVLPIASADVLGNGYDVSCKQANPNQVICSISGCPRVHEDLAGDVVHTKVNGGPQSELDKACGNTTSQTINTSSGFTYSIQGCRKRPSVLSDLCGAFSDYTFTPPKPAAPAPPPVPAPNSNQHIHCTAAGGGYDLPVGSDCSKTPNPNPPPAPAPVTNAIQLSFSPVTGNGVTGKHITATVANSSALTAKCTYDSSPGGNHLDFTVGPKGSSPLSFDGVGFPVTYHVVVSCHDASGKQPQEIGHQETNVTF